MLSPGTQRRTRAAYEKAIHMLGVPAQWVKAANNSVTAELTVGFRGMSTDDQDIVNQFGIEAKILTIVASDLPEPPSNFDLFHIGDETFTANAVNTVYLNGQVVSYRIVARGR